MKNLIMTLNCVNSLITDNLAIHVDINNNNSWNLNTGLTLTSINTWSKAVSDDINLKDFGLTSFDNGRVNDMLSELTLTKDNTNLLLFRIGNNDVSGGTYYNNYQITAQTSTIVGNYFTLNGGYFQGFFKLFDYNYEIFPPRYNEGITIETLIELLPQSSGIFFMMGLRAEDKYNPFFSGETTVITGTTGTTGTTSDDIIYYDKNIPPTTEETYGIYNLSDGTTGSTINYSGITTSEGHYLVSTVNENARLLAYSTPEDSSVIVTTSVKQLDNIKNNIIAFEITGDKKLKYSYVDSIGNLIQDTSKKQLSKIGWTLIDIVFKPDTLISGFDLSNYQCYNRRLGTLIFYVNGRKFWEIKNFDEFYFSEIINDREKQIGVPFNISWGGGSFGLKHSYHFSGDTNTIVKDITKDDLLIEKYFNRSFIGNIQKISLYNNALTEDEIFNNLVFIADSNINYGITITNGGRIISQYETICYIPQQTSGSDLRKSIRYRNADGSYKNLYSMLDIKVLIKSRSNEDIELVKFNKSGGTGWLSLIFINDYVYDFIVPDEVTTLHPNEMLFAEIKFQWYDPDDIDVVYDKIFIVNITDNNLLNNTIKNY